jgi:hypothetical protein
VTPASPTVSEIVMPWTSSQAEEHVRMAHLGGTAAVPFEGGLGVGRHGGVVALDEGDAVTGP